MPALFFTFYLVILVVLLMTTIGYIILNDTIDPADKPMLIQACYMLYFSTLVVIGCQFLGQSWF